jgi:choice-of-anchor A domain-containing protein
MVSAFLQYLFFRGDYTGNPTSDIQGKAAVGGSASFGAGFSIGELEVVDPPCSDYNLIVGKKLTWTSGDAFFGDVIAGDTTSTIGSGIIRNGCQFTKGPSPINFNAGKTAMENLCTRLSANAPTARVSIDDGGNLDIVLSGRNTVEYIEVPDWSRVYFIRPPQNYVAGAVLVFNLKGASVSISNMNMESLANIPTVFTACEATSIRIQYVAVRGSVLAPKAEAINAQGVIWGFFYGKSLDGNIQVNLNTVRDCI